MFTSHMQEGGEPYEAPPGCIAYVLQQPFKEELGTATKTTDIVTLGNAKMVK